MMIERHTFTDSEPWLQVEKWTRAKSENPNKNEDIISQGERVLLIADGATDKTGFVYPGGQSGGQRLAQIAARVSSESSSNGYELAREITLAIQDMYEVDNPLALNDSNARAATTLALARVEDNLLKITQIGDTNIRITMSDGSVETMMNDKRIDTENAALRQAEIRRGLEEFIHNHNRQPNSDERAAIIAEGRNVILDRLKRQHIMQNSSGDQQYGYGTLDGATIPQYFEDGRPTNYVIERTFSLDDVGMIEIVSDGFYGEFPRDSSKEGYAELYKEIHETDPEKYLKYLSTKPIDDASVLIAKV